MATRRLYCCVNKAYTQTIFYTQTNLIFDTLRQLGATVLVDHDFDSVDPRPGDQLIEYGFPTCDLAAIDRFPPADRWLYVVDEAGINEAPYDRALRRMAQLRIANIVVTYPNAANLAKLERECARYVVMPQCVPCIRPPTAKTADVLVSGQLSSTVYPTRTRVASALQRLLPAATQTLAYPGCDTPGLFHQVYGDRYYQHVEQFRLGVCCRAGNRDRFVAKYAEMGACHVLPVGDCPSYMPTSMKAAMVNVDGMSDSEVAAEVARLLASPTELQARTAAFTADVAGRYLVHPNLQRVVDEVLGGQQVSGTGG